MLVIKIMDIKTDIRAISFRPTLLRQCFGFTLVELMITVTIVAIVLVIGIPSFKNFVLNQRVKTASSQIFFALTLARSEAIKRNAEVRLVKTGTNWQDGWTVSTVTGSVTLSTQEALSNVAISGPASSVTYSAIGRLTGGVSPTFSVEGGSSARCVSVSLSGVPSTKTGTC